jgi:toxin HigB-1
MDISFATKKLRKIANDGKTAKKELGEQCARKLKLRLDAILMADTLDAIRNMSGRFHELRGEYEGTWACDLQQPYRLIFEPMEIPIPVTADGGYDWSEIRGINILSIIDYH